jgi:hypothetical protein
MAKIWKIEDGEAVEIKDIIRENSSAALTDAMDLKMFMLCMKTAEDFIKLSRFFDLLPFIDRNRDKDEDEEEDDDEGIEIHRFCNYKTRLHTNCVGYRHFISREQRFYECKLEYDSDDQSYIYTFEPSDSMIISVECVEFIRNMTIDIYHPSILSIELLGGQTIMPMEDGFDMKVFPGFTRFTKKGDLWFPTTSGISGLKLLDKLIIRATGFIKLPLNFKISFETVETVSPFRGMILEKNKIVKDGQYWLNIRTNGDYFWKSEMVRYNIKSDWGEIY